MHYRIGEFAKLGGVSIKTLRFYDEKGLLRPAAVDPRTQYRLYQSEQLRDLSAILALKNLGASLAEIAIAIRPNEAGHERRRLLVKLRGRAAHSLVAAGQSLRWIDAALNDTQAGPCNVPVVLRRRDSVRVASVRATATSYEEIGLLERNLWRAIDATIAYGLQGVLWHRCAASGVIEGEPFVEIRSRARQCADYQVRELPSATFATAYCEPTDADCERVYDSVSRWIHVHGLKLDGAKREVYVGRMLEVQFPVCAA